MCELLGITLEESRHTQLMTLDTEALEALRVQIKQTKSWPL